MKNIFESKILALLSLPNYEPMDKSGVGRTLHVRTNQRVAFRTAMVTLEDAGEIARDRKGRYQVASRSERRESLTGTIRFSRDRKQKGATVTLDEVRSGTSAAGPLGSLFIPGRYTGIALEGDRVEVCLVRPETPHEPRSRMRGSRQLSEADRSEGRGLQARVIRIIERHPLRIVGRFYRKGNRVTVVPEDGRLPSSFRLSRVRSEAEPGDVVVAKFVSWEHPESLPVAEMVEILGKPEDPQVDLLSVIHRFRLPLSFPDVVLREAERVEKEISSEELEGREDWRGREIFTIDPTDARDFDDAVGVSERSDGSWEVAVHIADVSHYVSPGSALDREARKRGNSTYLPDRVIPMLPEALSNGICSLRPDEDRLTFAAILGFSATGEPLSARFVPAVIRSSRRYTYAEAMALLELDETALAEIPEEKERQLAEHVRRAGRLAAILRKRRFDQGALDLEFPEVRAVLDDAGRAVGVERSESDASHQLIEEFMLAANEAVACETKRAGVPSIYRVHESPDPAKLAELSETVQLSGYSLSATADRKELGVFLRELAGKPEAHSLKVELLRTMSRAVYSARPDGHYGLAKADYTHFTSPIRRYADLVIHRVLRSLVIQKIERTREGAATMESGGKKSFSRAEMIAIAEHVSVCERTSAEAEGESQRRKLIEYLERLCADNPQMTFTAHVTETKSMGIFVELDDLLLRGLISKESLAVGSSAYFDRRVREFRDFSGTATLRRGSEVEVRLRRVDQSRGFLDFFLVTTTPEKDGPSLRSRKEGNRRKQRKGSTDTRGAGRRSKRVQSID